VLERTRVGQLQRWPPRFRSAAAVLLYCGTDANQISKRMRCRLHMAGVELGALLGKTRRSRGPSTLVWTFCFGSPEHAAHTQIHPDVSSMAGTRINSSPGVSPCHQGSMGVAVMATLNYEQRAEECRRLAKVAARPEDWGHFLEMSQTWDLLAALRQNKLNKTFALAQAIAKNIAGPLKD
jgi:hypothetical protein